MNIQYVVKINEADETNPYTLYNSKALTANSYPKVTMALDYTKKENKYDKYHIIQYSKGNDIIYLVKNPDKTQSLFLAIFYNDDTTYLFKDFQEIKNADDEWDTRTDHISIIKMQYIEPYLLFLLAETVGKTISDKEITRLKEKKTN
jgi:hypothetical protein